MAKRLPSGKLCLSAERRNRGGQPKQLQHILSMKTAKNERAEVHDRAEEMKEAARELKEKAREAGLAALDATRATYHQLEDRALAYSHEADRNIREHTYTSLGIAFGVGLMIGVLLVRNNHSEKE
jgi:ElaB/YqjD/DUF883 family membrane-anchored ribosome-binding protein